MFSTHLAQFPLHVPNFSRPIILRTDPDEDEDVMIARLRHDFPTQCKAICFPIDVYQYFDSYDTHLHGYEYLRHILGSIAIHNATRTERVERFVWLWKENNCAVFDALAAVLSQVIFTNEEIDMYGEDFLQEAAAKILLLKTEVDRKVAESQRLIEASDYNDSEYHTQSQTTSHNNFNISQRNSSAPQSTQSTSAILDQSHPAIQRSSSAAGIIPERNVRKVPEQSPDAMTVPRRRGNYHSDPLDGAPHLSNPNHSEEIAAFPSRGLPGPYSYHKVPAGARLISGGVHQHTQPFVSTGLLHTPRGYSDDARVLEMQEAASKRRASGVPVASLLPDPKNSSRPYKGHTPTKWDPHPRNPINVPSGSGIERTGRPQNLHLKNLNNLTPSPGLDRSGLPQNVRSGRNRQTSRTNPRNPSNLPPRIGSDGIGHHQVDYSALQLTPNSHFNQPRDATNDSLGSNAFGIGSSITPGTRLQGDSPIPSSHVQTVGPFPPPCPCYVNLPCPYHQSNATNRHESSMEVMLVPALSTLTNSSLPYGQVSKQGVKDGQNWPHGEVNRRERMVETNTNRQRLHYYDASCGSPRESYKNPVYEDKKLYVTNLSNDVDEAALMHLFSQCGLVTDTTRLRQSTTGFLYIFITFESAQDAAEAIRKLNNYRFDSQSRTMRVEYAYAKCEPPEQPKPQVVRGKPIPAPLIPLGPFRTEEQRQTKTQDPQNFSFASAEPTGTSKTEPDQTKPAEDHNLNRQSSKRPESSTRSEHPAKENLRGVDPACASESFKKRDNSPKVRKGGKSVGNPNANQGKGSKAPIKSGFDYHANFPSLANTAASDNAFKVPTDVAHISSLTSNNKSTKAGNKSINPTESKPETKKIVSDGKEVNNLKPLITSTEISKAEAPRRMPHDNAGPSRQSESITKHRKGQEDAGLESDVNTLTTNSDPIDSVVAVLTAQAHAAPKEVVELKPHDRRKPLQLRGDPSSGENSQVHAKSEKEARVIVPGGDSGGVEMSRGNSSSTGESEENAPSKMISTVPTTYNHSERSNSFASDSHIPTACATTKSQSVSMPESTTGSNNESAKDLGKVSASKLHASAAHVSHTSHVSQAENFEPMFPAQLLTESPGISEKGSPSIPLPEPTMSKDSESPGRAVVHEESLNVTTTEPLEKVTPSDESKFRVSGNNESTDIITSSTRLNYKHRPEIPARTRSLAVSPNPIHTHRKKQRNTKISSQHFRNAFSALDFEESNTSAGEGSSLNKEAVSGHSLAQSTALSSDHETPLENAPSDRNRAPQGPKKEEQGALEGGMLLETMSDPPNLASPSIDPRTTHSKKTNKAKKGKSKGKKDSRSSEPKGTDLPSTAAMAATGPSLPQPERPWVLDERLPAPPKFDGKTEPKNSGCQPADEPGQSGNFSWSTAIADYYTEKKPYTTKLHAAMRHAHADLSPTSDDEASPKNPSQQNQTETTKLMEQNDKEVEAAAREAGYLGLKVVHYDQGGLSRLPPPRYEANSSEGDSSGTFTGSESPSSQNDGTVKERSALDAKLSAFLDPFHKQIEEVDTALTVPAIPFNDQPESSKSGFSPRERTDQDVIAPKSNAKCQEILKGYHTQASGSIMPTREQQSAPSTPGRKQVPEPTTPTRKQQSTSEVSTPRTSKGEKKRLALLAKALKDMHPTEREAVEALEAEYAKKGNGFMGLLEGKGLPVPDLSMSNTMGTMEKAAILAKLSPSQRRSVADQEDRPWSPTTPTGKGKSKSANTTSPYQEGYQDPMSALPNQLHRYEPPIRLAVDIMEKGIKAKQDPLKIEQLYDPVVFDSIQYKDIKGIAELLVSLEPEARMAVEEGEAALNMALLSSSWRQPESTPQTPPSLQVKPLTYSEAAGSPSKKLPTLQEGDLIEMVDNSRANVIRRNVEVSERPFTEKRAKTGLTLIERFQRETEDVDPWGVPRGEKAWGSGSNR